MTPRDYGGLEKISFLARIGGTEKGFNGGKGSTCSKSITRIRFFRKLRLTQSFPPCKIKAFPRPHGLKSSFGRIAAHVCDARINSF